MRMLHRLSRGDSVSGVAL